MPEQILEEDKTDKGYFGIGIYATDNIYYASMYNGVPLKEMKVNEISSIFCCYTVYNRNSVYDVEDMSLTENQPIPDNIVKSYGINHALVGSVHNYRIINENEREKSRISAEEFVFGNKYQIIPILSFSIMKTDFYVLWIDENNKYLKEYNLLRQTIKENIYYLDSKSDYSKCVQNKILNKIKLIVSCDNVNWAKDIIKNIREIIGSNFVCLLFSDYFNQGNSFNDIINVLFTSNTQELTKFAKLDMKDKNVNTFINEINRGQNFNIDQESLTKFAIIEKLKAKEANMKKKYI